MRGTSKAARESKGMTQISIHVPLAGNVEVTIPASIVPTLISIHVPLAGNVSSGAVSVTLEGDFYPRSPCGERRIPAVRSAASRLLFLSTFPLRGTSCYHLHERIAHRHFYPRSPCGERHTDCSGNRRYSGISIHVPLAGNVV